MTSYTNIKNKFIISLEDEEPPTPSTTLHTTKTLSCEVGWKGGAVTKMLQMLHEKHIHPSNNKIYFAILNIYQIAVLYRVYKNPVTSVTFLKSFKLRLYSQDLCYNFL
jgi:hypothetical protein